MPRSEMAEPSPRALAAAAAAVCTCGHWRQTVEPHIIWCSVNHGMFHRVAQALDAELRRERARYLALVADFCNVACGRCLACRIAAALRSDLEQSR